jgi:hypothetical protein
MQDLFDNLQTNHPKGTELLKASEAFTEKVNAKRIGGWNMAQIIERHTDSCRDISWQDQGGKFAPKLAVWIAGEQWNDKIPPKVNGKNPHEIDYPEL